MSFRISQNDACDFLSNIDSDSIDLIITDPPYESLEKHRAIGTTTRLKKSKSSSNEWFAIFPNSRFEELLNEIYRVLITNSHFYMFCDSETMFEIVPIAKSVGFKFWKPIVWDKVHIGMGYHYRCRHEFILFFEKGKRKLNNLSIPDVLEFKRIKNGYPTEKPSDLIEILLLQSSSICDVVLDPFMGSGSVGFAALKNQRNFLGNDISEQSIKIANGRLKDIVEHVSKTG